MGKKIHLSPEQELVNKIRVLFENSKDKTENKDFGFEDFIEHFDETDVFTSRLFEYVIKEAAQKHRKQSLPTEEPMEEASLDNLTLRDVLINYRRRQSLYAAGTENPTPDPEFSELLAEAAETVPSFSYAPNFRPTSIPSPPTAPRASANSAHTWVFSPEENRDPSLRPSSSRFRAFPLRDPSQPNNNTSFDDSFFTEGDNQPQPDTQAPNAITSAQLAARRRSMPHAINALATARRLSFLRNGPFFNDLSRPTPRHTSYSPYSFVGITDPTSLSLRQPTASSHTTRRTSDNSNSVYPPFEEPSLRYTRPPFDPYS